jgi:hypothetical protein
MNKLGVELLGNISGLHLKNRVAILIHNFEEYGHFSLIYLGLEPIMS